MHKQYEVVVCGVAGCLSSHSDKIKAKFIEVLAAKNLSDRVNVYMTGCFGLCEKGPVVVVYPDQTFYAKVKESDVEEIVNSHIINGKIVDKLAYHEYDEEKQKNIYKNLQEMKFYSVQKRIALRNCGVIDPDDIDEYIAYDGYFALEKALNMEPLAIIQLITNSGLRGRGGGGFPTGVKWQLAEQFRGGQSYVICNADEGDPGAFMDRAILEGDSHSVIEAMIINGYAIGASQGYVYIRAEYPQAVKRLQHSIKQAYEYGLLGKNILGSGFDFDLEVRLGAGAFVCGEETALISSIEGKRGMPRTKPPFPAEKGLWGRPTIINNVETYANIPPIILNGPEWFQKIGTAHSKGTKVFALGGKVNITGLIEVPMGTTLRQVIYDVGGGIPNGKKFKAVQTGGPSGGCLTEEDLDTPIDYDNLINKGSMMGSGGIIVMDEDNCMVDVAKFYLDFIVDESCGKCTPCREGTRRLYELLEQITEGKGTLDTLEELKQLCYDVKETSLCGLGQSAPNPILSTLEKFHDEYIEHVVDKKCRAGVCKSLIKLYITDKCIGCTKCARNCPVDCISGELRKMHRINTTKCIKCGACLQNCPVNAIIHV